MNSHYMDLFLCKLQTLGYSALFELQYERLLTSFFGEKRESLSLNEVEGIRVQDCLDYLQLSESDAILGLESVGQAAILKLNGGLGTTMGCDGPKSLIPVFGSNSFLDIIFQQVEFLRKSTGVDVPLFLMDSFATHEGTQAALNGTTCQLFLQHQIPRIHTKKMTPAQFPHSPDLEWAPPGHGDVFWVIHELGILDDLLAKGIRYMFISNSDNLGATFDTRILGMMVRENLDMVMEVSKRTALDVKGGAIVKHGDRFRLLERAQVQESELSQFEDIDRFSVFNTNSIWVDLKSLKQRLLDHRFELPVIVNPKVVEDEPIIQLEMAMGAAIEIFDRVQLLHVPKSRFLPVKKVEDLIRLRSLVQCISESGHLVMANG